MKLPCGSCGSLTASRRRDARGAAQCPACWRIAIAEAKAARKPKGHKTGSTFISPTPNQRLVKVLEPIKDGKGLYDLIGGAAFLRTDDGEVKRVNRKPVTDCMDRGLIDRNSGRITEKGLQGIRKAAEVAAWREAPRDTGASA